MSDHLGNNRVVLSESGAVRQVNRYYPFGGLIAGSSDGNSLLPERFSGPGGAAGNFSGGSFVPFV